MYWDKTKMVYDTVPRISAAREEKISDVSC